MLTRNYEYFVYPNMRVEGEGIKISPSSLVSGLDRAKETAKALGPGAGIYSVTHGRFVGWITPSGRYRSTTHGYTR